MMDSTFLIGLKSNKFPCHLPNSFLQKKKSIFFNMCTSMNMAHAKSVSSPMSQPLKSNNYSCSCVVHVVYTTHIKYQGNLRT